MRSATANYPRNAERQFKTTFTVRERLALEDLRVLTALHSQADVVRLALQRLVDHYELDRDSRLFNFRKRRDPRKVHAA